MAANFAKIPDQDFITDFTSIGPAAMAKKYETPISSILRRRRVIEKRHNLNLSVKDPADGRRQWVRPVYPERLEWSMPDGVVLVGSDAHIWPGPHTIMMRAFHKFCKEQKPKAVILHGDVLDFATISRWPGNWEDRPTVQQEIEAAQDYLHNLSSDTPRNCKLAWPQGNHDARLESKIANSLPELVKLKGVHLKDWFPGWEPCWSVWINDQVVVKHQFKTSLHAPHLNTLWAGKTIVTGHLHNARVVPFDDYNGRRYGVDSGCLAEPFARQFLYLQDNPRNWRSAFCVLTFRSGELLQPELVLAWDDKHVEFRGELIKV